MSSSVDIQTFKSFVQELLVLDQTSFIQYLIGKEIITRSDICGDTEVDAWILANIDDFDCDSLIESLDTCNISYIHFGTQLWIGLHDISCDELYKTDQWKQLYDDCHIEIQVC